MTYILIILVISGAIGLIIQLYARHRKKRIRQKIELLRPTVNLKQGVETATERLLKKSSRGITLTDMFDKNFSAKILSIAFISSIIHTLTITGVLILSNSTKLIAILVCGVAILLLPGKIKAFIIERRMKRISTDLPFVIDMMAVCIQSGMTIENAFQYLSVNTERINPDISVLFKRVIMRMEVSGMSEALSLIDSEVPSQELKMLASTLRQSIKFGSSIYLILVDLSKEMRELQLLTADEKVSALAAKMSLPMIVFILFPILALVGGPGFIRLMNLWS